MGEKTKTYLVDNNPVDVAEQDEQDFLKHNPTAVKAKTFLPIRYLTASEIPAPYKWWAPKSTRAIKTKIINCKLAMKA